MGITQYSHRPLIPVHNHVSDINKLQSFAAFIQTVSKSSPGIPAAANDPTAKVPLDVIAFFMFYQTKLSEIWASVEFLNKEANCPRSMFSAHVTGGSEFGRSTISLELTDTCETIGFWTRERDQLKRRYLMPFFRVGLPNSDHLLRILVDCTLESDTFGACFLERGLDGLFRIDEEFLMSELERFSDSFMEAMEKVLQLERGVFQEGRDGFWR
ncbi:hypothetical protein BCR33DRAFT_532533 [Rhizoclosmatium globosum]|uniref:Uncharacterized protein n=1 Tax=Rhizoclosmatium globosum TaxID=329046 RepID=A0A1Y2CU73_9FUNG|nr:hypothetical protein BCR33DRAFT_532533 [Rhizoclosmatium globosum]|eukprot:ORY50589.1 hypothetical protein BCR33DRAFT_532533 [Rhizoclosmatium globosum]